MNEDLRDIANTIEAAFTSSSVEDRMGHDANIVDALAMIAQQMNYLGNADASTPMGALEAHGKAMMDSADRIAVALHDIADAMREMS